MNTYLLVHGAWHGSWCWKHVARLLRAAGHEVYTLTQTGLGERSHLMSADITLDIFVQDLVGLLEWEDLADVVLVGHSFGGIAITGAAARRELARTSSGGISIPVPDPAAFGVSDPEDVAWLKAKCTPHPLSTYEDTFRLDGPVGNNLPATYIAVKPDYGPLAAVRDFAKSQKQWRYMEMDAGHDAMITSPKALSEILLAI